MPRGTEVPITPAVLRWAVEESGYTDELLADHLDVSVEDLASWKRGDTQPTRTPMRKLATKLHRQLATFLLPAPPTQSPLQVQFRSIGPQLSRRFSPTERRYLRRARRQQDIIGWLSQELTEPPPDLPRYSLSDFPDAVGVRMREQAEHSIQPAGKMAIVISRVRSLAGRYWRYWRNGIHLPPGRGLLQRLLPLARARAGHRHQLRLE